MKKAPDEYLDVIEEHIAFLALDGYRLGGTLYEPVRPGEIKQAAILNCGGGVRAAAYRRFARYLAHSGVPIFTYDYRGIAKSKPARLRGFEATIEDWSEYDCGGAIRWMRERYPNAELIGIAHSIGALLLGGSPNTCELARFIFICSHTGYFGDYRRRFRIPMALLWHGVMPTVTRLVGYFPARRLGLGDDIPFGVAMQWAGRRNPDLHRALRRGAPRARAGLARCAVVGGEALVVNVSDDAFATDAGTHRLLSYFPRLEIREFHASPADVGIARIGHFGFFRASARAKLWPRVLAYILQSSSGVRRPVCEAAQ